MDICPGQTVHFLLSGILPFFRHGNRPYHRRLILLLPDGLLSTDRAQRCISGHVQAYPLQDIRHEKNYKQPASGQDCNVLPMGYFPGETAG